MRSQILAEFLYHHDFLIGPVADVQLRNRVTFEDNEVGADAVDEEPAVMKVCGVLCIGRLAPFQEEL